jgi:hypothetical protein
VIREEFMPPSNGFKFDGTGLEYLQSIYQDASRDPTERLYAARTAAQYEAPPIPIHVRDMSDEQLRAAVEAYEPILLDHAKERDAKLRQLIEAGEVSETQALKVRAIYFDHDLPWVPIPKQIEPPAPASDASTAFQAVTPEPGTQANPRVSEPEDPPGVNNEVTNCAKSAKNGTNFVNSRGSFKIYGTRTKVGKIYNHE